MRHVPESGSRPKAETSRAGGPSSREEESGLRADKAGESASASGAVARRVRDPDVRQQDPSAALGAGGGSAGLTAGGPAGATGAGERELVRRAQAGDVAAYEELVRKHQKRVFAIVGGILRRREDVEDVAQQVFIKVYVSLKRFDQRSAFSTWLYKVAVNECRDTLRKKRARRLVYEADLSEEQVRQLEARATVGPLTGSTVAGTRAISAETRAELRQLLERLLRELNEEDRTMLVLKEVEGLSVEEIGDVLGLNVNTVKVRLFRSRGRLVEIYRKRLGSRGPEAKR